MKQLLIAAIAASVTLTGCSLDAESLAPAQTQDFDQQYEIDDLDEYEDIDEEYVRDQLNEQIYMTWDMFSYETKVSVCQTVVTDPDMFARDFLWGFERTTPDEVWYYTTRAEVRNEAIRAFNLLCNEVRGA